MNDILYKIFLLINVIVSLYVGLWLMFIKPIFDCCAAIDANILTGKIVLMTILKCLFASPVGYGIYTIGLLIILLIFKEY